MEIRVRVFDSFSAIPAEAWNRLEAPHPSPILDGAWLGLLEDSGSITPENGWRPQHLTLWRGDELVAGAPLYLRTSSWGDFVFDFAFAQAAQQYGFPWYPKLVGMSPATPAVGWQVLTLPGEEALVHRWMDEARNLAKNLGAISLQFNFVDPDWAQGWMGDSFQGWQTWSHQHFEWTNPGLENFGDYLGRFDKNQRRNILRERQGLADQGLTIRMVSGEEIPSAWFPLMGELYDRTNDRFGPWAARFLEPEFFRQLDRIRHLLVFAAAERPGDELPTALGFLLRKGGTLLGRYWGERVPFNFQYFNVCYYTPLEWAIDQKIHRFNPGAGSPLKVRRGFASGRNLSLHYFLHPIAGKVFAAYADQLSRDEEETIEAMNRSLPFKETLRRPDGTWAL